MTNKEAIEILELERDDWETSHCSPLVRKEAFNKAISALQTQDLPDTDVGSMVSRQASCVYCHEDSDGYVKPIEKNCHAFIRFGMDGWELSLKANGWHGSAKINYCPMCGRKLKNDK